MSQTSQILQTTLASIFTRRVLVHAAVALAAVIVILIPFYGVLWPSLVDLPEHLLTSKILWEVLTGTSNLNYVPSTYIGYKLFPYTALIVISLFKALGISLLYLPIVMSMGLAGFFAVAVTVLLYREIPDDSLRTCAIAAGLMLPPIASMYSAAWFIGFVNYMLAVTLVVVAVFMTERFLTRGGIKNALWIFLFVFLAYLAHPFSPFFWLVWCLGRGLVSVAICNVLAEWKRLVLLGATFLPLLIYHVYATSGSPLAPSTDPLKNEPPMIPYRYWSQVRLGGIVDGTFLRADDATNSSFFALFLIGLIPAAIIASFFARPNKSSQKMILASVLLFLFASVVNEKFFPIPGGHWLAYDYRFASTTYVVCTVVAAAVLIRAIPGASDTKLYRVTFAVIAASSAFYSVIHLFGVRSAYARFDEQARPYMEKVFAGEQPTGIILPRSKWHPDGTLIRLFICMEEPDCNPEGTTFQRVYSGDLYPVKLADKPERAAEPVMTPAPGPEALSAPRGMAVTDDGEVYVADTGNGSVKKFGADGKYLNSIGEPGTGEGRLRQPNGIAIDRDGGIYVTDAAQAKLVRFAPDGTFDKEWKGPDRGFYGPRDIAIGADGDLYIIDQGHGRIVRFDPSDESFSSWGSLGSDTGQFNEPTGLAVGESLLAVADSGNDRVQMFDLDGNFVNQWGVPVWRRYSAHYPDAVIHNGIVYVTSGISREVLAFSLAGTPLDRNAVRNTTPPLHNPSALAFHRSNKREMLVVLNTDANNFTFIDLTTPRK